MAKTRRIPQQSRAAALRAGGVNLASACHPLIGKAVQDGHAVVGQLEAKEAVGKKQLWDELHGIAERAAQAVVIPAVLNVYRGRKELFKHLRDPLGMTTRLNMLMNDTQSLKDELKAIAARHAGKTGAPQDMDETMEACSIGEQYELFMIRVEAIIPPTMAHILEMFTEAELIMAEAQAMEAQAAAPAEAAAPEAPAAEAPAA